MGLGRRSDILEEMRSLAASDPKKARVAFGSLLADHPEVAQDVLESASRPGEGRLRQMIATVFRTSPEATSLEPWLRRWQEVESDEFTRSAILAALDGQVGVAPRRHASPMPLRQAAEAYRYVADRLCHRIRNALPLPGAQVERLARLARDTRDPVMGKELAEIHAALQAGFRRVARSVEFDTGDEYLIWGAIPLLAWLDAAAVDFSARFGHARLSIVGAPVVRRLTVEATPFILDTLFGNIWSNAVQAAEPVPCAIELRCALDEVHDTIDILVFDNGPGFAERHLEAAFSQTFSTKSPTRGRGLLEVADAAARLQGSVELTNTETGVYRLRVTLPVKRL